MRSVGAPGGAFRRGQVRTTPVFSRRDGSSASSRARPELERRRREDRSSRRCTFSAPRRPAPIGFLYRPVALGACAAISSGRAIDTGGAPLVTSCGARSMPGNARLPRAQRDSTVAAAAARQRASSLAFLWRGGDPTWAPCGPTGGAFRGRHPGELGRGRYEGGKPGG